MEDDLSIAFLKNIEIFMNIFCKELILQGKMI
jgi:hypothetical protein